MNQLYFGNNLKILRYVNYIGIYLIRNNLPSTLKATRTEQQMKLIGCVIRIHGTINLPVNWNPSDTRLHRRLF